MSSAAKSDLPDISSLSVPALEDLRAVVDARIGRLEKQRREAAFREIEALARRHGLSKADLAVRYSGSSASPRKIFRHPSEPGITWNCRGRRPQWIEEYLASGGRLEELELTS